MSTVRADNLATRDGTYTTGMQNPVRGSAKAWVNFNGTGTVAIRGTPFNVTSITDNGTGDYTVNFTNALSDANYATLTASNVLNPTDGGLAAAVNTTTACRFSTVNTAFVRTDGTFIHFAAFGA